MLDQACCFEPFQFISINGQHTEGTGRMKISPYPPNVQEPSIGSKWQLDVRGMERCPAREAMVTPIRKHARTKLQHVH